MPASLAGQGEPGRNPRPSEFWRDDADSWVAGPRDADTSDTGPGDRDARDSRPGDQDARYAGPGDADVWAAGQRGLDARYVRPADADIWTARPRSLGAGNIEPGDADVWTAGPRGLDARYVRPADADIWAAGPRDADGPGADGRDTDGPGAGGPDADGRDTDERRARHVSGVRVIRRPWAAAAAIAGVVIAGAAAAGLVWASHTARPATPVGTGPLVPIPAGHWAAAPAAVAATVPRPTALEIPAIGVRTRLIRLGITTTGALQVPVSIAVAGWYTGSPRPGATGSAVIAGHIDSVSGPGVFFRLRELRPGDLVYVQRGHASMAVFKVTAVRMILKSKFPTNAVYGPVPNAQLRLITCGGTFDPATGHYLSNVIVFAVLQ